MLLYGLEKDKRIVDVTRKINVNFRLRSYLGTAVVAVLAGRAL